MGRFDERAFGYKRFQDFLEQGHGHLISIQRPSGAGDILVSLRTPEALGSGRTSHAVRTEQPPIRSDIWQAFTNPDPVRKRFLHKCSCTVRHFTEGQSNQAAHAEVSASPDDFIEISAISGQTQIEWMKRFLEGISLPAGERVAFEAMLNEPYSSGVNSTFTRALGEQSTAWRHFRTRLVTDQISEWAREYAIPMENLRVQQRPLAASSVGESVRGATLSPREQATRLLDLLSEDDIARLILPTLLSTILIKSRL